ncbi:hypothetical protein BH24DEI2_BH24DEI2_09560 [soil metagenome]
MGHERRLSIRVFLHPDPVEINPVEIDPIEINPVETVEVNR